MVVCTQMGLNLPVPALNCCCCCRPLPQVKYPASQPALPVGLTGTSFSAVFGANQSMLEAVTLKRHIMGPGWLTVTRPRRVAPESQVGGVVGVRCLWVGA